MNADTLERSAIAGFMGLLRCAQCGQRSGPDYLCVCRDKGCFGCKPCCDIRRFGLEATKKAWGDKWLDFPHPELVRSTR